MAKRVFCILQPPLRPLTRTECEFTFTDKLNVTEQLIGMGTRAIRRYALCYLWRGLHYRGYNHPKFIVLQFLNSTCLLTEFHSSLYERWGFANQTEMSEWFADAKMRCWRYRRQWREPRLPIGSPNELMIRFKHNGPKVLAGAQTKGAKGIIALRRIFEVGDFHVGKDWYHVVVLNNPKYLQEGESVDGSRDFLQEKEDLAKKGLNIDDMYFDS